ncbi:MAG: peptide deformylase [Actinobacteria bacterium]|nr:peptide deformylase [Actinomycetota bacterium]
MLLDILQIGNPVLRRRPRALERDEIATPFVQELIVSMRETMYDAPGVGLAAPQVGESLQVVVAEDEGPWLETMSDARRNELERVELPFTVLVNPVLEAVGEETSEFFEGCLSIEGFSALVRRHRVVRVRALDAAGEPFQMELEGRPARILQHELDHLAGVLYVDRMNPRTFTTNENLVRYFKARTSGEVREQLGATESGTVTG